MKYTPTEIVRAMNALNIMRDNATDAQASLAPGAYRTLKKDGRLIRAGDRRLVDGNLYRTRVDLWDTEENSPESVPSLWEKILYKKGIRIIPEKITAENPFTKGELGWWGDVLKRSTLDGANVYTPDEYAAGWEDAEET